MQSAGVLLGWGSWQCWGVFRVTACWAGRWGLVGCWVFVLGLGIRGWVVVGLVAEGVLFVFVFVGAWGWFVSIYVGGAAGWCGGCGVVWRGRGCGAGGVGVWYIRMVCMV